MGLWARTGRLTKALLLITAGAAGGGAAIAVASVPDSNGVIHGCYSVANGEPATNATLTIIDPSAGQSCATTSAVGAAPGQKELDWSVQGPVGPTGPQGAPGPGGQPGPAGAPSTVANGGTLLLGGQVLTVESAGGGVTLPTPSGGSGGVGDNVVLGSGRGALSFAIESIALLSSAAGGTSTGSGRASGKPLVKDISVTKEIDKSSPKLSEYCDSGQHFKTATITMSKPGGKQYLRYTLSQVYVVAIQTVAGHGDEVPREALTFNYGSLSIQYVAQGKHGVSQVKTKVHLP